MKITFLGTNGWFDTYIGNTTCAIIETKDCHIVLDAGGGFYKVKDMVKDEKPVYLFISHLHLDHIIGLHTLPLFKFAQGIDAYVPKEMEAPLKTFVNKPYSSTLDNLPTKVRLHEIDTQPPKALDVKFAQLLHSPTCYGYRFLLEGKTISYCTDTGDCENLRAIAKDADFLITECAFLPGEDVSKVAHLNPEVAAKVAKESGAKKLVLIHFDAGRYPTQEKRKAAEASARKIFPDTFAATDGYEVVL